MAVDCVPERAPRPEKHSASRTGSRRRVPAAVRLVGADFRVLQRMRQHDCSTRSDCARHRARARHLPAAPHARAMAPASRRLRGVPDRGGVRCIFIGRAGSDNTPNALYREFQVWVYAAIAVGSVRDARRHLAQPSQHDRRRGGAGTAWLLLGTIAGTGHDVFGRESSGLKLAPAVKAALGKCRPTRRSTRSPSSTTRSRSTSATR